MLLIWNCCYFSLFLSCSHSVPCIDFRIFSCTYLITSSMIKVCTVKLIKSKPNLIPATLYRLENHDIKGLLVPFTLDLLHIFFCDYLILFHCGGSPHMYHMENTSSYSSYLPFSESWWWAHNRAVMFQTLHRYQRDTGLESVPI